MKGEKADKRTITIGQWLRALVLDQEYHDTMVCNFCLALCCLGCLCNRCPVSRCL